MFFLQNRSVKNWVSIMFCSLFPSFIATSDSFTWLAFGMQQYVCAHCIRAKVQYVRCPIVEEKMRELGILMLRLFGMPANIGARLQLDLAIWLRAFQRRCRRNTNHEQPKTIQFCTFFCFVTGFPHNDGQIIATESRDNPKCSHKFHIIIFIPGKRPQHNLTFTK